MQIVNVNGIDKILMDHDDINVAKTIIYIGESIDTASMGDGVVLKAHRAAFGESRNVTVAELEEAYLKGCVISLSLSGGMVCYVSPYMYTEGMLLAHSDAITDNLILLADGVELPD